MTAEEFVGLHQEKLAAERNNKEFTQTDLATLTASTGYMFGDFDCFHKYAEKLLGRPIFVNQFGDYETSQELHEYSKKDFLKLHEKLVSACKDDAVSKEVNNDQ